MPDCPICGRPITKRRNKTCSQRCGKSMGAIAAWGRHPWTDEEDHALELLAETMPFQELVERYNTYYANKNGWVERSQQAIRSRLLRLQVSRRPTLDNFSLQQIAQQLDCSADRVRGWAARGLKSRKVAHNQRAVRKVDLVKFAQEQPHRFAGLDPERLLWLLEDAEVVEMISKASPCKEGRPRAVRRLDTGKVYPSCYQADDAVFVSKGAVNRAIKRGIKAGGTYWEPVEDATA